MITRHKPLALFLTLLMLLVACRPAEIASTPDPVPTRAAEDQPPAYPPPSTSPPLKPADSQELVSGICDEAAGDIVEIQLTADGPASPRCVKVNPQQRLKFLNGRPGPVQLEFGPFFEAIPSGGEVLLDRMAGEYLAPGVHLVEGAEIVLLGSGPYPAPGAGMPPTHNQFFHPELGYSVVFPSDWSVDDHGMTQVSKEVIWSPPDAEPFTLYLSILLDPRTLGEIRRLYADSVPDAQESEVVLAGQPGVQYTYSWGRIEIYLDYQGRVILIATDKSERSDVQAILAGIAFQ